MSETVTHCPECNQPLPGDAPQGVCPGCLLGLGAAATRELDGSDPAFAPTQVEDDSEVPEEGLPVASELGGRFPELSVQGLLGRGGMGAVYRARQSGLDREVALKVMLPELGAQAPFAERFLREARALARLDHPGIVTVYDFGHRDGCYYLLMEYVEGTNLRQAMTEGKLSPAAALDVVRQLCEALQFAHDQGVVHRDIKPENVLIRADGRVKVADFGLAKLVATPQRNLTSAGVVMGTPSYMSPEQMEGSRDVDHRADIYSLGVVFYELLTGELPLGRFAPPSERAGTDVRIDPVVLKALAKAPEQRYQQASEVATDLGELEAVGGPVEPTPAQGAAQRETKVEGSPATPTPLLAWLPRPSRRVRLGVLCLLLLLVGGVGAFMQATKPPGVSPAQRLLGAARSGHTAKVERLLAEGIHPDLRPKGVDQTALMNAAYNGRTQVLLRLIEAGADVHTKDDAGETALTKATWRGHLACSRLLLKAGAEVNEIDHRGEGPLLGAANLGQADLVKVLLEAGAAIDARSEVGVTPFLVAARQGHLRTTKLLLEAGSPIDQQAGEGWTGLLAASLNGQLEVVRFLVERGAKLELRDREGQTALLGALTNGHQGVAELLLEHGADAKAETGAGVDALMLAASKGWSALVERLLRAGCDPKAQDARGRNALYYALASGQHPIVRRLAERGSSHPAFWAWRVLAYTNARKALPAEVLADAPQVAAGEPAWSFMIDRWRVEVPQPHLAVRLLRAELEARRGKVGVAKGLCAEVLEVWSEDGSDSFLIHDWSGLNGEVEHKEQFFVERKTLLQLTSEAKDWRSATKARHYSETRNGGSRSSTSGFQRDWLPGGD